MNELLKLLKMYEEKNSENSLRFRQQKEMILQNTLQNLRKTKNGFFNVRFFPNM